MIVIEERKVCRMLEGLFQFDKECEWNDAIEEAMHRFVNLPTIEAEPVRHGKWEYVDYGGFGNWHCTACREICICNGDFDYCPNCGAMMDGERRTDAVE